MRQRQHVILCEGYDDRAFWSGWLEALGCTNLAESQPAGRIRVKDPWGDPVAKGGQFGFATPSDHFVRVVPYHSRSKRDDTARNFVTSHATKPVGRLVVNWDPDDAAIADAERSFVGLMEKLGGQAADGAWWEPAIWDAGGTRPVALPRPARRGPRAEDARAGRVLGHRSGPR